jgi:hypothetical protein
LHCGRNWLARSGSFAGDGANGPSNCRAHGSGHAAYQRAGCCARDRFGNRWNLYVLLFLWFIRHKNAELLFFLLNVNQSIFE